MIPNKRAIVALALSVFVSIVFLFDCYAASSIFNRVPFSIYNNTSLINIPPGAFAVVFDLFASAVLLVICYLFFWKFFQVYGFFKRKRLD